MKNKQKDKSVVHTVQTVCASVLYVLLILLACRNYGFAVIIGLP